MRRPRPTLSITQSKAIYSNLVIEHFLTSPGGKGEEKTGSSAIFCGMGTLVVVCILGHASDKGVSCVSTQRDA